VRFPPLPRTLRSALLSLALETTSTWQCLRVRRPGPTAAKSRNTDTPHYFLCVAPLASRPRRRPSTDGSRHTCPRAATERCSTPHHLPRGKQAHGCRRFAPVRWLTSFSSTAPSMHTLALLARRPPCKSVAPLTTTAFSRLCCVCPPPHTHTHTARLAKKRERGACMCLRSPSSSAFDFICDICYLCYAVSTSSTLHTSALSCSHPLLCFFLRRCRSKNAKANGGQGDTLHHVEGLQAGGLPTRLVGANTNGGGSSGARPRGQANDCPCAQRALGARPARAL
jgi:hypothetical protein